MHAHSSVRETLHLLAPEATGAQALRHQAVFQLVIAGEEIGAALRSRLAEQGLTIEGFQTLAALKQVDPEPASPTFLAQRTDTTRALLSHTLTRLEISGLISRHRDELDRRIFWVRLTPAGREAVERGAEASHRCIEQLTARLARPELAALISACSRFDQASKEISAA